MKSTRPLALALVSLTLLSGSPPPGPYVSMDKTVGLFSGREDVTVRFYAHNMKSTYFYFIYFSYIGEEGYYMRKRLRAGDVVNGEATLDFTFELVDRLIDPGIKVEFQICDSSSGANVLYTRTFNIIRTYGSGEWVYANEHRKDDFTIEGKSFRFLEDGSVRNSETVSFKNTVDYLTNTATNVLDISEISFWSSTDLNPTVSTTLHIKDTPGFFPYIKKNRSKVLNFEVDTYQVGNDLYFRYKDDMYVNPETLQMSLEEREGFIQTNQFYLPINVDERLEDMDIWMDVYRFGYSNLLVRIPLTFYLEKKYLGMCDLASFCIKGGIKQ